ncbi:MAG: hypothetical protein ACKV2T_10815 [Kofleriaceae bacterium]
MTVRTRIETLLGAPAKSDVTFIRNGRCGDHLSKWRGARVK